MNETVGTSHTNMYSEAKSQGSRGRFVVSLDAELKIICASLTLAWRKYTQLTKSRSRQPHPTVDMSSLALLVELVWLACVSSHYPNGYS